MHAVRERSDCSNVLRLTQGTDIDNTDMAGGIRARV